MSSSPDSFSSCQPHAPSQLFYGPGKDTSQSILCNFGHSPSWGNPGIFAYEEALT